MRAFNFSPGPAALPLEVLEQAREELLDWHDERHVGHGDQPPQQGLHASRRRGRSGFARAACRYRATTRCCSCRAAPRRSFRLVPLNLAAPHSDGRLRRHRTLVQQGDRRGARAIARCTSPATPAATTCAFRRRASCASARDAAYVHYTPNETISGVEFGYVPETGGVPLVADMSSSILSRPIDVSKFGLIYAGAQKNIGPSGLTVVIVREDLHRPRARRNAAGVRLQGGRRDQSMLNTPPTFAWYMAGLVFKWLKSSGGLAAMGERNRDQGASAVCRHRRVALYRNSVAEDARSRMNVTFTLEQAGIGRRIPCRRRPRPGCTNSRAIGCSAACARASTTPCRSPASRR